MDINEMIEKWEKKHSSLLNEFNSTRGMMTEREICECVDHRKNVLRFLEDLRQVKNCSIPDVSEWISVDSPPQDQETILLIDHEGNLSTAYHHGRKSGFIIDNPFLNDPIKWKPIQKEI